MKKLSSFVIVMVALAASLHAQEIRTWNNPGTSVNDARWDRVGNWAGPVPPQYPNSVGSVAIFGGIVGQNGVNIAQNVTVTVGSIQFTSGGHSILGPGTLIVDNGGNGATIELATAHYQSINVGAVVLNDHLTVNNVAGSTLRLKRAIGGSNDLIKEGAGTLTLSGDNSFSGETTINEGTVILDAEGALANTSAINLNGGTLFLGGTGDRINDEAVINLNGGTLTGNHTTEVLGQLNVLSDSFIDLTSGGDINFSGVNHVDGTLTIYNWTGSAGASGTGPKIYFTEDPGDDFLSSVVFAGFDQGGMLLGNGELVAVPEVNTVTLLLLGLVGLGIRSRASRKK